MRTYTSFVPTADDKLYAWSAAFFQQINATPTAFGLVAAQATAYGVVHAAFGTALSVSNNVTTRTKATVNAKDVAKKALQVQARSLGGMIQKNLTVTDAQKIGLGITVRSKGSPVPPPDSAPTVEIVGVAGATVSLRFRSTETIGKRGRPAGVSGAQVWYCVTAGDAPADEDAWTFYGNTTKTDLDVVLPDGTAPGTQVWISACWMSPTMMTGPAADPISTHTQFGSTVVVPQPMKRKRAA